MIKAKRVCIFVDGENFRNSIVELFPTFKQHDYLPKTAGTVAGLAAPNDPGRQIGVGGHRPCN